MKIYIFFLIILFSFSTVYANTLSFTDFDLASQEIDFYYSNGTKYITIKSNESVVLESSHDYQVVFRPEKINILNNPMILFNYIREALAVLVVIGILILGYKALK